MKAKEKGLTGLSLVLLAYWELRIGEIPLGLFAIRYDEHQLAFSALLTLELLLASILISRALLQHYHGTPPSPISPHCHDDSTISSIIHK